eukprot:scaffold12200_cov122-Cylindrotheca_fusiformis.AAC.9
MSVFLLNASCPGDNDRSKTIQQNYCPGLSGIGCPVQIGVCDHTIDIHQSEVSSFSTPKILSLIND